VSLFVDSLVAVVVDLWWWWWWWLLVFSLSSSLVSWLVLVLVLVFNGLGPVVCFVVGSWID